MKFFILVLLAVATGCSSTLLNTPAGPFGYCPDEDGDDPVYLMDLKNRYVYYECSNGIPRLENCSSDLAFNPRKNICDWVSSTCDAYGPVGVCPTTEESTGPFRTLLRDGCNISVFYMCVDGQAKMMSCEEGLVFDPYRDACFQAVA